MTKITFFADGRMQNTRMMRCEGRGEEEEGGSEEDIENGIEECKEEERGGRKT